MARIELQGHKEVISHAIFDTTGKYVLTTDGAGVARVWDSKTGKAIHTFENVGKVKKIGLTRSGTIIYMLTEKGTLDSIEVLPEKNHFYLSIPGESNPIKAFSLSRDGRYVIYGNSNHRAVLLDRKTLDRKVLDGHTENVYLTALDRGGTLIATASDDKTVKVWQREDQKIIASIPFFHKVFRLKFDKSSSSLTIISEYGHTKTWDLKQQEFIEPSADSLLSSAANLFKYWAKAEYTSPCVHPNPPCTRICTYDDDDGQCRIWDPAADSYILIDDAYVGCDNPFNKHGDRLVIIKKSDSTKAVILTDPRSKFSIASLALALHGRLGHESPANTLSSELFVKIYRYLQAYSFL
jgi:WD40 repeat protein